MRSTFLRSGLLHLLSLALVVSLHRTVAEWTWPSVSDHHPTILGRPVTGLLSLALVLALPRTIAQSNTVVFDDPVLTGPKAVRVGSTATLTCVVPKVQYTRPEDFEVRWVVKFGHLPPANVSRTVVDVQDGGLSDVHQVTSKARLYFSTERGFDQVQCVASLTHLDITKKTENKIILAYVLTQPVMTGPTRVRTRSNVKWTCSVLASIRDPESFRMIWAVAGVIKRPGDEVDQYGAPGVTNTTSQRLPSDPSNPLTRFPVPVHSVVSSHLVREIENEKSNNSARCVASLPRLSNTAKSSAYLFITYYDEVDSGKNSTNPNDTDSSDNSSKRSASVSRQLLVGLIAAGVVLFLVLLVACLLFVNRRRHRRKEDTATSYHPGMVGGPSHPSPMGGGVSHPDPSTVTDLQESSVAEFSSYVSKVDPSSASYASFASSRG